MLQRTRICITAAGNNNNLDETMLRLIEASGVEMDVRKVDQHCVLDAAAAVADEVIETFSIGMRF